MEGIGGLKKGPGRKVGRDNVRKKHKRKRNIKFCKNRARKQRIVDVFVSNGDMRKSFVFCGDFSCSLDVW